MYKGKGLFEWQLVTVMEALTININRSKDASAVSPNELNPFIHTKKKEKSEHISDKAAKSILKSLADYYNNSKR